MISAKQKATFTGVTMTWGVLRLGGGDGLQTWRVAANILNNQSPTADMGWWLSGN